MGPYPVTADARYGSDFHGWRQYFAASGKLSVGELAYRRCLQLLP